MLLIGQQEGRPAVKIHFNNSQKFTFLVQASPVVTSPVKQKTDSCFVG